MTSSEHFQTWDDFYAAQEEPEDRRPVPRQPKPLTCRNCYRIVISDGHEGFVHDDDYKYACDVTNSNSTFAEIKL